VLGNVDICASNFWETDERRGLTTFTTALTNDNFKILSLPEDPEAMEEKFDFWGLFTPILAPFEPLTWALIVGNFVLAGLFMWLVEAGGESPDYADEWEAGLTKPLGALKGIYLSFMGFICGSAVHAATVWAGRLVLLGCAFTTMLYVAAYQANLAAFMVGKSVPGALIESFTDVEQIPGGKICMLEAVATTIQLSYGWGKDKIKGTDDFGPMLEILQRSKHGCVAAIIGKFEYLAFIEAQSASYTYCADEADENQYTTCSAPVTTDPVEINLNCKCSDAAKNPAKKGGVMPANECPEECPHVHRHCNLLTVEDLDFSLSIPLSMPANEWIQDYFSAWIVTYKLNGEMDENFQDGIISKYCKVCKQGVQVDECANLTAAAGNGTDAEEEGGGDCGETCPLFIGDMLGTYILSGAIMFLGILLRLFQMLLALLPAKFGGGAGGGGGGDDAGKAEATIGFSAEGGGDGAGADEALKKEVEALTDDINAMLDKLKAVDDQSRG